MTDQTKTTASEAAAPALKPCPFCGCAVQFRRYMQVAHPDNGCILTGLYITDEQAKASGDEVAHKWNQRHAE